MTLNVCYCCKNCANVNYWIRIAYGCFQVDNDIDEHVNFGGRFRCLGVLKVRRLVVPGLRLLLCHHADDGGLRRLRGAAEPAQAPNRLLRVQHVLHRGRPCRRLVRNEPSHSAVSDDEHRWREARWEPCRHQTFNRQVGRWRPPAVGQRSRRYSATAGTAVD